MRFSLTLPCNTIISEATMVNNKSLQEESEIAEFIHKKFKESNSDDFRAYCSEVSLSFYGKPIDINEFILTYKSFL